MPFQYAERVLLWNKTYDPVLGKTSIPALEQESYKILSEGKKREMVWRHGFPKIIDKFIRTTYCRSSFWENVRKNRWDPVHHILAEIQWSDAKGEKHRTLGKFEYSIDDDEIYHRYFKLLTPAETLEFIREKNKVEFPDLSTSHRLHSEKAKETDVFLPDIQDGYTVGPLGTIVVEDIPNNITITLFKLRD